jgi:hypothetical protein
MPPLVLAATFVATSIVGLICLLLGALAGARRPGVALVAGWGIAVLVLTACGTTLDIGLTPVLAALGLASLCGLWRWRRLDWSTAGRVLALGLPYLLILASVTPAGYDEYTQWLPNLAYLQVYDHFPNRALPDLLSIHPGYPNAVAFVGLAASRIVGHLAESAGIVWNGLLTLAVASLAADLIGKTRPWARAALATIFTTLASPAFISLLYVSSYGDAITGLVCAAMFGVTLADLTGDRPARTVDGVLLGLCGAAGVAVRPDSIANVALVYGAATLMALWRLAGGWGPNLARLLAGVPLTLLSWALWQHYQVAELPNGVAPILPRDQWMLAQLPDVLRAFLRVAMAKSGYFGLLALMTLTALWPRPVPPRIRGTCAMAACAGIGKIVAMAGIYMAVECCGTDVRSAPEYWRYTIQIAPAVMFLALSLLPADRLLDRRRRLAQIAAAAALLLPVAGIKLLRIDWPRPGHVDYPRERVMAADIARIMPPAASLTLVELDELAGNNPQSFPLRYLLRRDHPADKGAKLTMLTGPQHDIVVIDGAMPYLLPHDAALAQARQAALDADYLWLSNGGPDVTALLGMKLPEGVSLLLHREADGKRTIVARWTRF